eukprot:2877584-Pyramimonas_sp.AAC.1
MGGERHVKPPWAGCPHTSPLPEPPSPRGRHSGGGVRGRGRKQRRVRGGEGRRQRTEKGGG